MAMLAPLASVVFLLLANAGYLRLLSEKDLLDAHRSLEPGQRPVYYLNYLPASAVYYSQAEATKIAGTGPGLSGQGFWLAVHKTEGDIPNRACSLRYRPNQGAFSLYLCRK
jgi:hypothetical protein